MSFREATPFMTLMETFHMSQALVMVRPFYQIYAMLLSLWSLPMLFGMGIFIFMVHNLISHLPRPLVPKGRGL